MAYLSLSMKCMHIGVKDLSLSLNTFHEWGKNVVIDSCVKRFTNLLRQDCTPNDDITQAQSMLFKSVKDIGGQHVMIAMEEDIKEEEVECVLIQVRVGMELRINFLKPLYNNSKAF